MGNGIVICSNVIVVQYTPSSPKKYLRVSGNNYEEVSDASKATAFKKKKEARCWIRNNFRYPEFTTVEDIEYHVPPLR